MRNSETPTGESAVYEICYLLLPSIPEDKLADITDAIRKVIAKEGGTEIDAEAPFKETLAYTMSKTIGASRYVLSDAYLGWIKFDLPLDKTGAEHPIEVIRKEIEKMEAVLRFLLTKALRETTFTFAKARTAVKEQEAATPGSIEETVVKS